MTNTDLQILASKIVEELTLNQRALKRVTDLLADSITEKAKKELPEKISKNIAYKHFGRKYVDEWVSFGLIEVEERGNRLLLLTKRLKELDRLYQFPNLYEREKEKYLQNLIV